MDNKIKARLKQVPSDFVVKEILPDRCILDINSDYDYPKEGNTVHCILKKENIDQFRAVGIIASELGLLSKDVAICGTKDKRAHTTQRVSIKGSKKEDIGNITSDNLILKYLGRGPELRIGELYGNHFEITLRDIDISRDELLKYLQKIKDNPRFPNHFGEQRFGSIRPISHIVGKHVILGDFKGAVLDYICLCFLRENETIKAARTMAKTDLKVALEMFPKSSYYERVMMVHLIEKPEDYRGAFFRLPSNLQKLMVHAYQSYLFNKILDKLIVSNVGNRMLEIPLFGFGMNIPKDLKLIKIMRDVLKEEKISLENFRDDASRQLGSKGGRRKAFQTAEKFKVIEISDDELNLGKIKCKISFSLRKGTYATVFLGNHFEL
ncbi:MAG: tRNA pseudouridine(13) synthase TruD [Nanohaloarchaea archaeon]|nr:tRNA pseudouridine(13) synthase TruD [Candidatus Nanohaloarchaea archaeon]